MSRLPSTFNTKRFYGLESYASDLNPVAVLINKAMIEIPPKFAGRPPVNPEARTDRSDSYRQTRQNAGLDRRGCWTLLDSIPTDSYKLLRDRALIVVMLSVARVSAGLMKCQIFTKRTPALVPFA
jgi:hypothetical protein